MAKYAQNRASFTDVGNAWSDVVAIPTGKSTGLVKRVRLVKASGTSTTFSVQVWQSEVTTTVPDSTFNVPYDSGALAAAPLDLAPTAAPYWADAPAAQGGNRFLYVRVIGNSATADAVVHVQIDLETSER